MNALKNLTGLEEGEYTKRDKRVKEIAERLRKSDRTPRGAVSGYVSALRYDDSKKDSEFRMRTASQILESGYITGCTDSALVFLVLARELGTPSIYVETLDEKGLQNADASEIRGHVFVDCQLSGDWRAYEPRAGFTTNNDYILNGRRFVEVGKGVDFSEVYVKINGVYRTKPINLQSSVEARVGME
jgi:hypothetical protein